MSYLHTASSRVFAGIARIAAIIQPVPARNQNGSGIVIYL